MGHARSSLWRAHLVLLALLLGLYAVLVVYDQTHACREDLIDIYWDCKGILTIMGAAALGLHAVTSSLGIWVARSGERGRPRVWSRWQALGVACMVHATALAAMVLLVRGC
jgi:hypothetical protein